MDGVSGDIISEAKSLDQQFEYPDRSIVSYAQNREDVLLWRAFHRLETGFYIDVGAHDPEIISVTRAFYERGWSGVNIEPDPFFAEKLRRMRERDRTLQVALGRCPGKAVLFDFGDSGLSTTKQDIAIDTLVSGRQVGQRDVEVMTLSGILAEIAGQDVHFLKIDVEGAEARVIAGAATVLKSMRPILLLEVNDKALRAQGNCADSLIGTLRGDLSYEIFVFSAITGLLERQTDGDPLSANVVAIPGERISATLTPS